MKNLKVLFTVLCMLCTVGSLAETVTIYSEEFSASSNTLVTSCSASNFTGGVTPTAVNSGTNGWKLGTGNAGSGTGFSGGANLWSATNNTTVTFTLGDKLKNYSSVKISFHYYKGSGKGSNNTFNLKFSSDGGKNFGDNVLPSNTAAAATWYSVEIDIPAAALSNFAFRFTQTGTQTNRIDDIKITGVSAGSTKTLDKIELSRQKTEFTQNDTWSFGGTVTATYTDKSTADVTSKTTFSGYNMANTGRQTVTASYTEGSVTKTATYSINVAAPKTLTSIAVTTAPKTSYTTCETLVVSDWVVTGTYSDASTADVTSACTFSKANGASLLTTDTKVTVTHTATSKTCEKTITVSQGTRDTFVDHIQGNADQYGDCNGYTVPSCDDATKGADCAGEHYKFIGWSSTTISTGSDTEPAGLLKAGDSHDATGTTYYAVWAKGE